MNRVERLIASPVGAILVRPWFDEFALKFFERWFFPSSRLWAAARAANGSLEEFFTQIPLDPVPRQAARLASVLQRFECQRAAVVAAEDDWEKVFFGALEIAEAARVACEKERLDQRTIYNEFRRRFTFLTRHAEVPPVRWQISTPIELAAEYARVVNSTTNLFAAPKKPPVVTVSRSIPSAAGRDYWIRFNSPSGIGDMVFARVSEPDGVSNPPTVIFLHGVGVEFDHWHGMIDDAAHFCRMGMRVVRPEAPWHGRRVAPGSYGGERFIATMPRGSLEFFSTQVREVAVLMEWCRASTDAPVAVGGSSLGAHVARVVASQAREWQQRLRPDGLLLITPCGRLQDAAIEGSFARVWGSAEATGALGWGSELRSKWFSLIDPKQAPIVPPERIVSVLGRNDQVTPFASGDKLMTELGIPVANKFCWPLGHFSIPLNLVRDPTPLHKFRSVLDAI